MLSAVKTYFVPKGTEPEIANCDLNNLTKEFLETYGVERLGTKTKLFFDYDRKFKDDSEAKLHYKEMREQLLGYNSYRHPVVITESVQPNKVSFHVVFTDPRDAIVRSEFLPEDEKELFSKIVGQENFQYIDDQVYGKKLWFRLPYGTIENKPYPHLPLVYNTPVPPLRNYVLTIPDESETKDYKLCPARLNRQFKQAMNDLKQSEPIEIDDKSRTKLELAFSKLNPARFKDYKKWVSLAFLMKSCGMSCESFCELSRNSGYEDYKEKDCKNTFNSIKTEEPKFGLLINWLKEDGVDYKSILYTKAQLKKISKHEQSEEQTKDYLIWKEEFEKNHAKIMEPCPQIIMKAARGEWAFQSKSVMKEMYSHLMDTKNIDRWWDDPTVRVYSYADIYSPSEVCPKECFNLWTEYPHQDSTEDEMVMYKSLFIMNHIRVLANHNEDVYNYIMQWVGQFIQFPQNKTTGLFFASKEGAGKDTFALLLKGLIGSMYETTRPDDIFGRFNTPLLNNRLIVLNECDASDTAKHDGGMKMMITDQTLPIEAKGTAIITMRSFHRLIGFTNQVNYPIQTSKGERRKLIIRCSDEKIGDKEYFTTLYSYIHDPIVLSAMFSYFKQMDVSEFNMTRGRNMPHTDYQEIITEGYSNPVEDWLRSIANNDDPEDEFAYNGFQLQDSWKRFKEGTGLKIDLSLVQLGVRIKLLNFKGVEKKHTKKGILYCFNKKVMGDG